MGKFMLSLFMGCVFSLSGFTQNTSLLELVNTERWLNENFVKLYDPEIQVNRDSLNNEIINRFAQILESREAFFYTWDQLKMIGKLKSEDNKIRIFTWHLQLNEKEYKYYGLIQSYFKKGRKWEIKVFVLNDKANELKKPETLELNKDTWFGSLYYGIHTYTFKKKVHYALMGYDFNNNFSDRKVIDVLKFDGNGNPGFGGTFYTESQTLKRVIFEYSSQIVMTLRYDNRLKMIVFDHLSPLEPIFSNNYQFYSPDGSYDGFKFEKGVFILVPDVDARNEW